MGGAIAPQSHRSRMARDRLRYRCRAIEPSLRLLMSHIADNAAQVARERAYHHDQPSQSRRGRRTLRGLSPIPISRRGLSVELRTLSIADKLRFEGHPEESRPHRPGLSAERNRGASQESRSRRLCQRRQRCDCPMRRTVLRLRQAKRRSRQVRQWQPDEIHRQSSGSHSQRRECRGDDPGRARRDWIRRWWWIWSARAPAARGCFRCARR